MADIVQIFGDGNETPEVPPERQQLIDDLERLIGSIRRGEIEAHHERAMICFEQVRRAGDQMGVWPVGYRAGGMQHPFNVLESTGMLRWIAHNLQNNNGSNL